MDFISAKKSIEVIALLHKDYFRHLNLINAHAHFSSRTKEPNAIICAMEKMSPHTSIHVLESQQLWFIHSLPHVCAYESPFQMSWKQNLD